MATSTQTAAAASVRRITLTLDVEAQKQIDFLREDNQRTFEEEVLRSLKFGIENRAYRKGYMARKNQQRKQLPQQLAKATNRIADLERQLLSLQQQQQPK